MGKTCWERKRASDLVVGVAGLIQKRNASTNGHLSSNFDPVGAILCEICTDANLERLILVQVLRLPHVKLCGSIFEG